MLTSLAPRGGCPRPRITASPAVPSGSVEGVEGAGETVSLAAPPDGVASYHVFVLLPRSEVPAERNDLELTLKDLDSGSVTTYGTIFRGPKR